MDICRREFLQRSAASGAGLLAAGARARRAAAATQIVITDSGGEYQKAMAAAYYQPFEKETGIKVIYSTRPFATLGRIKAMVEARNVEWDLTSLDDYLMYRGGQVGLLEAIDYARIDTTNVMKSLLLPFGVGSEIYAVTMAYNTKKWPSEQGPKTWADFWDVKRFPGRRSMMGIGYGPMEMALLADGVAPGKLYPLDVRRALAKMDEIRPHVKVWWSTAIQSFQLMMDDEVDLIQGWNARFQNAIDNGAPFAIEWNQGISRFLGWVIPRGAANIDGATKFLNFLLRPQNQAKFAAHHPHGPVNLSALAYVAKPRATLLPTYEENLKRLIPGDARVLAEQADMLHEKWTEWKAK